MKTIYLSAISLIFFSFIISPALSATFDPDYLISDSEIRDYNSMNINEIQEFLDSKPGTLKNYITIDKEGNFKTATQSFYEIAQKWRINPKYLLVLVQKEMSLLTDTTPKQSQYDWATGYGCPDGQSCNTKYKGFYKQVNSAAAQHDYYMENINLFHYQPDKTYNIDGYSVSIKNTATAGLYSYTPHVDCDGKCGGNKLFWNLWNMYFSKKWPDGSLLHSTSTDEFYLIEKEQKREIISKAVLLSRFDLDKIIEVTKDDLEYYETGVPIKYPNFTLVQTKNSDSIYMIVGDQKRKFATKELFTKAGFKEDEIIEISSTDLALYDNGSNITEYTLYPAGALLQDEKTGDLFYILSSKKKPVVNKEILNYNFQGLPIETVPSLELNKYRTSAPVTLPEGELIKVKNVNTVYVISNGKRLPIFSGEIFLKMNYKWENVIVISEETLEVHPLGQTITGDWL